MIGLSGTAGRLAETTPTRTWTNVTGNTVGGTRTADEQVLPLTPTGAAPTTLNGLHTLATNGKALDDPDHSTASGTPLITWTPTGGANQNWRFTQRTDGSYEIANVESGLCTDVEGSSTTAGARVVQ
ncbi:RICIN domain-containing protein [Streptomyces sp. NPDC056194]|uniref:RICIN domain-containing protein n=1 Tax=unclassified Streptomyces TaxID=2593676 RepID=UPI0035E17B51